MESHHATLGERVKYLEKALGDSADKHTAELNKLRDAHTKHAQDIIGHTATVDERLCFVEKLLGDSANNQGVAQIRRGQVPFKSMTSGIAMAPILERLGCLESVFS